MTAFPLRKTQQYDPKGHDQRSPMKRPLLLAAAGLAGSLFYISPASAQPVDSPSVSAVAPASGSPVKVLVSTVRAAAPTALPSYRVVAGDTLWAIGVRYHRTWPALASYNHIADHPDLIYVGDVIVIPPASFTGSVPSKVSAPSQPLHNQYGHAPANGQVSTPVSHTRTSYVVPVTHSSGFSGSSGGYTGIWACIAQHESGGNPSTNTGNGYYGGLQFTLGTWQANGGSGNPASASAAEQQRVAENVVRNSGGSYGAWPNTSRMCGA